MAVKLGLKIYEWVQRFARKLAAKPSAEGIMQVPSQEAVRNLSNEILTKFMKHNVSKEVIKSENDVKIIFNQIKNIENQAFTKNFKTALTPKKSADVLDLTGKKIQSGQTIVGGKGYDVDVGGIKGIEQRMDKIQDLSDQLAKLQKEKSAMYGKKPTDAELKSKLEGMN